MLLRNVNGLKQNRRKNLCVKKKRIKEKIKQQESNIHTPTTTTTQKQKNRRNQGFKLKLKPNKQKKAKEIEMSRKKNITAVILSLVSPFTTTFLFWKTSQNISLSTTFNTSVYLQLCKVAFPYRTCAVWRKMVSGNPHSSG